MFCCRLLLLWESVQKYVDEYADVNDPWFLVVEDWNYLVAMRDLLSPAIFSCKDLESDLSVTCSKMLKRLYRLRKYFKSKLDAEGSRQRTKSSARLWPP